MENIVLGEILNTPRALELLLRLKEVGTSHGDLVELFGKLESDRAKDVLENLGLIRMSDLNEFITPKGREMVLELRKLAGAKDGPTYEAEAAAIRSAIPMG